MDGDELDDSLWLSLTDRIGDPASLAGLPEPVGVYFATRLVEWDVLNGGVAQVLINNVEWLPRALDGYRVLQLEAPTGFFAEVVTLAERNVSTIAAAREGDVVEEFMALAESPEIAALDARLEQSADELSCDGARVAYVRANRGAFRID